MRKQGKVLFGSGMLVVCCLLGTWWYMVQRSEQDARNIFNQALLLKVGTTPIEQVLDLVRTSPGQKYGFEPCFAALEGCTGTIYVTNHWLSQFHLAPVTAFGARFGITQNRLTNREFVMDVYGQYGERAHSQVHVNERVAPPGTPTLDITERSSGIVVNMTTAASEDIRKLAYDINFECLTTFGGCRNDEDVVPILKRQDLRSINPQAKVQE